jgi:TrmH family RNA methyltransferase
MLVERITSRQNPLVRRFRRVRTSGEPHLALLEGVRLVEEALDVGAHFESIAFTSDLESTERGLLLKDALQRVPCRGAELSKQVMDYISETESPQGIAALVTRPHFVLEDVIEREPQLIVIADGLQDPGNIGAIVRTAEAAGCTGMAVTQGTVSPYNPKALRASMGSALRLPIAVSQTPEMIARICGQAGITIMAASPATAQTSQSSSNNMPYTEADFRRGVAIVMGSEGGGIASGPLSEGVLTVHIPMAALVDSLNVASSAAIVLYEAARQRNFKFT